MTETIEEKARTIYDSNISPLHFIIKSNCSFRVLPRVSWLLCKQGKENEQKQGSVIDE